MDGKIIRISKVKVIKPAQRSACRFVIFEIFWGKNDIYFLSYLIKLGEVEHGN